MKTYTFEPKQLHTRLILFACLFAIIFSSKISQGQTTDSPSLFITPITDTTSLYSLGVDNIKLDLTKELLNQLVPLDSILKLSIYNNPGVKAQEALIEAGNEQIKLGRREWQNGVFLSYNQNVGNQTLFYNTNQEPIGTQSQSLSTGYRLGFNVNIPLYLFFARNNRINIYKQELEVRKETNEKLKLDLERIVIAEYNNMLSTHRILLIASNSRSAARMLMDMANQQFQQGDISIGDYTSVMGLASKAESDYEIAKRDFYTWYQQLERLVGVRLDKLTRKP
jgi:outer membrane protein TolC